MMLSDAGIREYMSRGMLFIEPYDPEAIQPASVDLRLAKTFTRFKKRNFVDRLLGARVGAHINPRRRTMEHVKETTHECEQQGFVLHPGEFALGSTRERVRLSEWVVGRVEGKSSLGRLGLSIHTTAGFIDPGFSGYVTLELYNQNALPIILYPNMWICQIAFHTLTSKCESPYGKNRGSRYTDQTLPEPVLSRVEEKLGL